MFVEFESDAKLRDVLIHNDKTTSIFVRGKLRTADKKEIDKLMTSPRFNKDIRLQTPLELVADYLEGKDPDRFTLANLDEINDEGILKLAKHFKLKPHETGNKPVIIKRLLSGKYLDAKANEIVREHQKEKDTETLLAELLESEVITRNGAWYSFGDDGKTNKKDEVLAWVEENKKDLVKQLQ